MFAGLRRRVVLGVAMVLLCGQVAAQELGVWQFRHGQGYLMITTNDPHGIVVADASRFAAVNIGQERAVAVAGFFPTDTPAKTLKSVITLTDGSAFERKMGEDAFVTHQERGVPGYAYVFIVEDEDLELLKAAATWTVEASGNSLKFPMKGSRKAIEAAEDAAKRLRDARLSKAERDKWQGECIRLAEHPWDDNTTGAGVAWGDLDAEAATKACVRAIGLGADAPRIHYLHGRALDKAGDKQTLEVLRRASEAGYVPASYHLGLLYWDGDYGLVNKAYGRWMIKESAEAGYLPARHQLSTIMIDSGDNEEWALGMRMLRANADKGYTLSQRQFAKHLESGEAHGAPDPEEALKYHVMAAGNGNEDSAFRVAEMYRDGIGSAPNPRLYLQYLRNAAELGHKTAKQELGLD